MNLVTNAAIKEVYDCHELIQSWFRGEDATPELLEQLLAQFSNKFSMITPSGKLIGNKDLHELFLKLRGTRPDVIINVTKPNIIFESDNSCILNYEEIQQMKDKTLHRISTAVFINTGIDKVNWLHLHETWITDNK